MRKKIFLNSLLFITLLVLILLFLSAIVTCDYSSENLGIRSFYKEKRNTIDVVFMGASATYTNWLTTYAWHKHGIPSGVYAIPCMPCGVYKYILQDINEYQNPKVIVVNIDSILPWKTKGNHLIFVLRAIESIKWSKNKIQMINSFKKAYRLNNFEILEYYFPILRFHSSLFRTAFKDLKQTNLKGALISCPTNYYSDTFVYEFEKPTKTNIKNKYNHKENEFDNPFHIEEEPFDLDTNETKLQDFLLGVPFEFFENKKAQQNRILGYPLFFDEDDDDEQFQIKIQSPPENLPDNQPQEASANQPVVFYEQNWEKLLDELFLYIVQSNQKIILITNPTMYHPEQDTSLEDEGYEEIFERAKKYNIPCMDLKNVYENNPMNLTRLDFLDATHLNYSGAKKFTEYFCKYLEKEYGLKDKRKNQDYQSWNTAYNKYVAIIKEKFNKVIEE